MNDDTWICPICLSDDQSNCHILEPCNHKFHVNCIIKSLRINGSKCPLCRGEDTSLSNHHIEEHLNPMSDIYDIAGNNLTEYIDNQTISITINDYNDNFRFSTNDYSNNTNINFNTTEQLNNNYFNTNEYPNNTNNYIITFSE